MRVQGREKWVRAKWRGVEKCSVGTVRERGLLGGIESGEGGNLGKEGGERYRGRSLCGGEAWRILQGEGQGRGS